MLLFEKIYIVLSLLFVMNANEGRLQSAEHIFARVVQNEVPDTKIAIAKFEDMDTGVVEFRTETDLRNFKLKFWEKEVNVIIKKDLPIRVVILKRSDAKMLFDLSRVPENVEKIRVVSIGDFDSRPCKDQHVSKTSEIGDFELLSVERVGLNRYRFRFMVF